MHVNTHDNDIYFAITYTKCTLGTRLGVVKTKDFAGIQKHLRVKDIVNLTI